jgi:hypothetical protein
MATVYNLLRHALLMMTALWLAGCASPYGPNVLTGGYKDEKLGENRWRVSFNGNGYTDEDMVVKYWLNRCAELTVKSGYSYFNLVPGTSKSGVMPGGPIFDLTPGEHARLRAEEGRMVQVRSAPTYIWVPSYGGGSVRTWSKTGVIVMFHTRAAAFVPEQAYALHAQTVLDMLKKYVESGGKEPGPTRKEIIEAAMILAPVPAR